MNLYDLPPVVLLGLANDIEEARDVQLPGDSPIPEHMQTSDETLVTGYRTLPDGSVVEVQTPLSELPGHSGEPFGGARTYYLNPFVPYLRAIATAQMLNVPSTHPLVVTSHQALRDKDVPSAIGCLDDAISQVSAERRTIPILAQTSSAAHP